MVLVTKLILAKPAARTSEEGAEATGEAYMAALDDVATWAVEAAIRLWHRGESIKTEKDPHDFKWRPEPPVLRKLARIEEWKVRGRIEELRKVLGAEVLIEFSDQERADNLDRLSVVLHAITDKPMAQVKPDSIGDQAVQCSWTPDCPCALCRSAVDEMHARGQYNMLA